MMQTGTHNPRIATYPGQWAIRLGAALVAMFLAMPRAANAQVGQIRLQPDSGRDCAVCHLEWAQSFDRPGGIVLLDRPAKPVVAESDTCLGCHDGSIADSRREVWLEHSHKTGITPSAATPIPNALPLENGKLACRTCHTAHAAGMSGTLRDAVFLRIANEEGQLCRSCHTNKSEGPAAGTHPLGKLHGTLPAALADAGAHAGRNQDQLVCQTCHTAHGSRADHLLVISADSNKLCLNCHEQMAGGMWRDDAGHGHPQSPPLLKDSYRQAIRDMGTRTGPDNTLICLSCHKMHHGQSGRAMLADTLRNSQFCLRCHPERADMANTAHDLRKSAPRELNAKGQSPEEAGPCGACHTFHRYARQPSPAEGDPQGVCATCHSEGQIAAKHTGRPFSHPSSIDPAHLPKDAKLTLFPDRKDPARKSVACLSCHDPHKVAQPHFLRSTGDELCANCHAGKVNALAGPHDFSNTDHRNGRGETAAQTGKCGFCHAVHKANGPAMWVATASKPAGPDALCAECHKEGGPGASHPVAQFNHPTGPKARPSTRPSGAVAAAPTTRPAGPAILAASTPLPLFNENAHQTAAGFVSCSSCHDVHQGGAKDRNMLRFASASELCVNCHNDKIAMAGGLHDPRSSGKPWPPGTARPGELCTACHKPHSNDSERGRWAVAPKGTAGDDAVCGGCHGDHLFAADKGPFTLGSVIHPRTVEPTSPLGSLAHNFPLAGTADGKEKILCKTCHNPHAGPSIQHLLRTNTGAPASDLCLSCHEEPRYVVKSMHAPDLLDPARPASHACLPCHATHAVEGSRREKLWSTKLDTRAATEAEQHCLGCHDGRSARRPQMTQHPVTSLSKLVVAESPEVRARVAAVDPITCGTCHLAHGREPQAPTDVPAAVAKAVRKHDKPMLKPNVDRDVCALCHGLDSTRVHLYFHNAEKRKAVQRMTGQ